jgi:hypothetical protein
METGKKKNPAHSLNPPQLRRFFIAVTLSDLRLSFFQLRWTSHFPCLHVPRSL